MFTWLPLLAAGLGIVGNIMGNNTTTNTTQNQATSSTGAQSQVTAGGQTTQGTTAQTAVGTTTENVNQSGTSATQQNTTEAGVSKGNISRLDDTTLSVLQQRVREQLTSGSATQQALSDELQSIKNSDASFDPDSFVQGIMRQTADTVGYDLESQSNSAASQGGVSSRGSSMQALLEGRLKGSAAATLAGAKSQAVGTAADISTRLAESKTARLGQVATQLDSGTTGMLNSLLQATQKETSEQTQTGAATGSGQTTALTGTNTVANQQTGQTSTQKTATTGTAETRSSENGNTNITQSQLENKVDWTKVFSGIGGMFSATF